MNTIALYRKYLYNSLVGKDAEAQAEKLFVERNKINGIIEGVDICFYGDKSLFDKKDKSIYTYIKRDIIKKIVDNEAQLEAIQFESKFYLSGLINEIDELSGALTA